MSVRVRAPALVGRRWLNVGGDHDVPTVAALRGRVVVLHFSTSGCVNCTHAEAELDRLAAARPAVVVIGVHSPKFPHEGTLGALETALDRAGTTHPVLDDADHSTWDVYAVRAWPTLVVLDGDGRIAGTFVGEGHLAALDALVGSLLRAAPPAGTPAPVPVAGGPGAIEEPGASGASGEAGTPEGPAAPEPPRGLRHPAAALALPDGRLLVADAGHRRLVVLDAPVPGAAAGAARPRTLGTGGQRGSSPWVSPAGMALLPPGVAARVGWDVAVADPGAHVVRGVRLADGAVLTIAGAGEPLRPDAPAALRGGPALAAALSSPTGLAWCAGRLVLAMSGVHQLWTLEVADEPGDGVLRVVAGSGVEGLLDGAGADAMLAQPSAVAADDPGAWFVDAESSALRRARPADPRRPDGPWEVTTLVGTGTYAFGHVDGEAADALMQHPLGLAVAADGAVLVADTYDGAVRRVDVGRAVVTTLVDSLAEPVAVVVRPGGVLVVESAAHRLTALDVADGHVVAPGRARVTVDLTLPAGHHLDGAPADVEVTAVPPGLVDAPARTGHGPEPRTSAGTGTGVSVDVVLASGPSGRCGVLVVRARASTCTDGADPGAACRAHERTWRVPVAVEAGAPSEVTLAWDLDRPR